MTALLTDNLPLLAGAPNGIKKLRELILELAVRGKLVEQDARDEPASELLKCIAAEKARLVANKAIKPTPQFDSVSDSEELFDIPPAWAWVRMGEICRPVSSGSTPSSELFKYDEGVPFLKVYNIRNQEVDFDYKRQFVSYEHHSEKMKRSILVPGDVLMNIVGPPLGKVAIVPNIFPEWNCNQAIVFFGLIQPMSPEYVFTFLKEGSFLRNIALIGTAGQDNISVSKSKNIAVPIPPLSEQHRIVAKVDELMALCDRLENQQADAASAHAQLVQALLGSLTQASDATEFATNWQRLAEHFHTLFNTEPSIDALKQTLLQLAVMGKLVPQDSNDEPANELLKRIVEEKARLAAEGKIRRTKQFPEITGEDKLRVPPNGWKIVRFGQVIELVSGQHLGPDEYFESTRDGAIPYLTGPADFGETCPRPTRFTHERRATSVKGDILLTVKGSGVGKTNFVDQDEFAISRQLMAIRPIIVDAQFVRNMLLSMSEHFQSKSIGIAIPGISREDVLDALIGIPPLAEQHRIVDKLDQLMALCDQLKTQLSQARQLNGQLASTLVEQAVA